MTARGSKDHELHFVSRGSLAMVLEGTDLVIPAGHMLYTGPSVHYGVSHSAPADLSCFHCHFTLPGARVLQVDLAGWAGHTGNIDAFAAGRERLISLPRLWPIRKPAALTEQFLALMNDQRGRQPGDAVAAQARFLLLLHAIATDGVVQPRGRATRSSHAHVARALDLIERKPGHRATLAAIASTLGIEAVYLARLFRKQVGCTLGSYSVRRSMAIAQERLLSEPTTVKDIGRSLGYVDPLYFSRVFRREVGCSPREFRNRTLR